MSASADLKDTAMWRLQELMTQLNREFGVTPKHIRVNGEVWDELVDCAESLYETTSVTHLTVKDVPIICDLPATHPKDFVLVYEV